MNLFEELSALNDPELVEGVVSAIGPVTPKKSEVFTTVAGYYLDHTNPDVLAVYVISVGRLIRYEHATTGVSLTSCLPVSRVARISQQTEAGRTTVVIETDADRITLSGTSQQVPGSDGPTTTLITANLFPSAWVIEATDPRQQKRLASFAARARAVLAR